MPVKAVEWRVRRLADHLLMRRFVRPACRSRCGRRHERARPGARSHHRQRHLPRADPNWRQLPTDQDETTTRTRFAESLKIIVSLLDQDEPVLHTPPCFGRAHDRQRIRKPPSPRHGQTAAPGGRVHVPRAARALSLSPVAGCRAPPGCVSGQSLAHLGAPPPARVQT